MKIRLPLILFFLGIFYKSFSQIPVIRTNAANEVKNESLIYNHVSKDFDFVLAFTASSYWSSERIAYQGLALKGGIWQKFTLNAKKRESGKFSRPRIKFKLFKTEMAEKLIADLTNENFWTLNKDSLNIQTQLSSDSITVKRFGTTDGTTFRFEVFSDVNYRLIEAYEPEYYLKKIPEIKIRKNFIRGTNLFLDALKNNGT